MWYGEGVRKGEAKVRPAAIRAFRKKDKLSQAQLAELATLALQRATGDPDRGISESLIALIETNRRQPSRENAEAIAAALDVPLEAIGDLTDFEAAS